VGLDSSANIITGFAARNQYAIYPEHTVMSIKRKMGSGKTVKMGGKSYTPAQISSEILKTLKQAAEKETGMPVQKAVITVPAYFTNNQRQDTVKAGELAGLDVVRIINEPTAAALAYSCGKENRENILVYDLGGGTFDISLIQVEQDIVEVLATDGNNFLGGDDFDLLLQELLLSNLSRKISSLDDLRIKARLKNIAEKAKILLSSETEIDIKEEFITTINKKPVHLETKIFRNQFEEKIEKKLNETFKLVNKVLKEGKKQRKDISKLLLVGGSTYIPKIFNVLSEELLFNVHREVDPQYCVAMGAAIQGAIIAGENIDTILVDVNSHSLGVKCLNFSPIKGFNDDHYSIVIHKNTALPSSMSKIYYTCVKNQKQILIDAYQGENSTASKNRSIGSFYLKKLPKNLPENSEIEIKFEYNLNGIVEISAMEKTKGKAKKMKIDINRLKKEHAGDEIVEEKITQVLDKKLIKKMRTIIKTAKKKSKNIDNIKLKEEISNKIEQLEKAMQTNNPEAVILLDETLELISEI